MAEFGQTMRQWKRMCDYCAKTYSEKAYPCTMCPASSFSCRAVYKMDADTDWDKIADVVEKWATEHPEPQYPTWWEWLADKGIVPAEVRASVAHELHKTKLVNPIPASIAEKLGLKPKEANGDG